jgi:two-component system sensor histidine kinase KdpD
MTGPAATPPPHRTPLRAFAGSLGLALGALAVAVPINLLLDASSLSRVFLVAVLISGATYGLWPSLFASLISVLIYDFFFIPPLYSLTVSSGQDLINLALFAVTAIIVSSLAARVRRYAVAADQRALTAEKLSAFNRRLAEAETSQDVLDTAAEQMSALLHRPVALLFPAADANAGDVAVKAHHPAEAMPDDASRKLVAGWWRAAGSRPAQQRFVHGTWQFLPLQNSDEPLGVVGIQTRPGQSGTDIDHDPLLNALVEQTTMAIERLALRERSENARIHAEAERLRAALLASISHDLRNPLAAIVGSASGLERHWPVLEDAAKAELVRNIRSEAERLDVFIANLLDITRIEAGVVTPRREAIFLSEAIGTALNQATRVLAGHRVTIDAPEDLPLVEADSPLLQQAIYNIIENAAKYAPAGSLIQIEARARDQTVQLRVLDEGPGIPETELHRVFDKFYRATNVSHQGGTGLGLAISRGFIEAMQGSIEIANRDDRSGTVVALKLPTASERKLCELEIS